MDKGSWFLFQESTLIHCIYFTECISTAFIILGYCIRQKWCKIIVFLIVYKLSMFCLLWKIIIWINLSELRTCLLFDLKLHSWNMTTFSFNGFFPYMLLPSMWNFKKKNENTRTI